MGSNRGVARGKQKPKDVIDVLGYIKERDEINGSDLSKVFSPIQFDSSHRSSASRPFGHEAFVPSFTAIFKLYGIETNSLPQNHLYHQRTIKSSSTLPLNYLQGVHPEKVISLLSCGL